MIMTEGHKFFIMMIGMIIMGFWAEVYIEGLWSPLIIGVLLIFGAGFGYYGRKMQEADGR